MSVAARTLRSKRAKFALGTIAVLTALAILAPWVSPHNPIEPLGLDTLTLTGPSTEHWFGTDRLSRDLLSRVLFGARVSLAVAALSVGLSITLGTAVGVTAGLSGGLIDTVLMRGVDSAMAVPRMVLLIVMLALWPSVSVPTLILILGFTSWFDTSRIVRAEVLSVRSRPFFAAAAAAGTPLPRLVGRHVLPNVAGPIIVSATLGIGQMILLEAGLSFLGVGVARPTPSWGRMIAEAQSIMASAWWTAFFPGLAIVVTVVAFSVLGDALRDALDPKAS